MALSQLDLFAAGDYQAFDPEKAADEIVASLQGRPPASDPLGAAGQGFLSGLTANTYRPDSRQAQVNPIATTVGKLAGEFGRFGLGALGSSIAGAGPMPGLGLAGAFGGAARQANIQRDELQAGTRDELNIDRIKLGAAAEGLGGILPATPGFANPLARAAFGAASNAALVGGEQLIGNQLDPSNPQDVAGPTALAALLGGGIGLASGPSKSIAKVRPQEVTPEALRLTTGQDITPEAMRLTGGEPRQIEGGTIQQRLPDGSPIEIEVPNSSAKQTKVERPKQALPLEEDVSIPKVDQDRLFVTKRDAEKEAARLTKELGEEYIAVKKNGLNIVEPRKTPSTIEALPFNRRQPITYEGQPATVQGRLGGYSLIKLRNGGRAIVPDELIPEFNQATFSNTPPIDSPSGNQVDSGLLDAPETPEGLSFQPEAQRLETEVERLSRGGVTQPGDEGAFTSLQEFNQRRLGVYDSMEPLEQEISKSVFDAIREKQALDVEVRTKTGSTSNLRNKTFTPTHIENTGNAIRAVGLNNEGQPVRYIISDLVPNEADASAGIRRGILSKPKVSKSKPVFDLSDPNLRAVKTADESLEQAQSVARRLESIAADNKTIQKAVRLANSGSVKNIQRAQKILQNSGDPQVRVLMKEMKEFSGVSNCGE